MNASNWMIGEWHADSRGCELRRGDETRSLQPRQMDVLMYLAGHPGEVVSGHTLLEAVWRDVVVEDQAVYGVIGELRRALGDTGAQRQYIETVPKRGYRLIAKVSPPTSMTVADPVSASRFRPLALASIVLLAIMAAWALWPTGHAPATSPSLAVLPFINMGEASEDYFSDGLTEEIITHAAQLPGLKVTGRTSSFEFRNHEGDLREVGQQLGVAHILEGSVRRSEDRLRITAQLIDADTGYHRWAQTWERPASDIFAIQEQIALAIAKHLDRHLSGAALPAIPSTSAQVYDRYLQGRRLWRQGNFGKARWVFEEVIALDPEFAPAWSGIASAIAERLRYSDDTQTMNTLVPHYAEQALVLQPGQPEAQAALAVVAYANAQWMQSIELLEKAIADDPSEAKWKRWYGQILRDFGYIDEALAISLQALEGDPLNVSIIGTVAYSAWRAGDYEVARRYQNLLRQLGHDTVPGFRNETRLLAAEGKLDELESFTRQYSEDELGEMGLLMAQLYLQQARGGDIQPQIAALKPSLADAGEGMAALAWLGDTGGALQLGLDQLDRGQWVTASHLWTPLFAPLRSEPEFLEIVRRHPLQFEALWAVRGWPDHCGPDSAGTLRCR
jgi:TolB-like protein/DNA-binding winged helix-turn-helix (wHTH) protein/Tfp pilus assembly protein PilF